MNNIKNLINSLRESFLVHSYLYYTENKPLVPDNLFDSRARYLTQLQLENPDIAKECIYQEYFHNFDPATGYDAPVDDWVLEKARDRINKNNKNNGGI